MVSPLSTFPNDSSKIPTERFLSDYGVMPPAAHMVLIFIVDSLIGVHYDNCDNW